MVDKVGRNAPCPCGSGRKYKRCCQSGAPATGSAGARPQIPVEQAAPDRDGMVFDEQQLRAKLHRIAALSQGATTAGEREAAEAAVARIRARLKALEAVDPAQEYQFSMPDMWSRKVFVALLRRYGLEPYRYRRQRYTTVMVRVSKRFVDEVLWPQYLELSETLQRYLAGVTDRVVSQALGADTSEAREMDEPRRLGTGG